MKSVSVCGGGVESEDGKGFLSAFSPSHSSPLPGIHIYLDEKLRFKRSII